VIRERERESVCVTEKKRFYVKSERVGQRKPVIKRDRERYKLER
jgi:hypothetical protein